MRKYLYIIFLAVLACTGCKEKVEMDLDMYNSEQVSLMVKGKKVFTFDEGNGQLGFNRTLRQFRTGNDDMTSFFVLTCSELPREMKSSAFSAAPPMRPPSMSFSAKSSFALEGLQEPPYRMVMSSAASGPNFSAMTVRMQAWISSACAAVAVLPVPMAQTGS